MNEIIRQNVEYVNATPIDSDSIKMRILADMAPYLNQDQNMKLKEVLDSCYGNKCDLSDAEIYDLFVDAKVTSGLSERTIDYYTDTLKDFMKHTSKRLLEVDANDIRRYLRLLQDRGCSNVTVGNNRRNLSAFYTWLETEEYIRRSPLRKVGKIKEPKVVKKPFTAYEIECMRNVIKHPRDRAIFELLLSSGMRVGELVNLDRDDIDYNTLQCVVLGKGNKQRAVCFSSSAKLYIMEYIKQRSDNNQALFVSLQRPYNRLNISAVEIIIRNIGKRAGVEKTHPHRFRRTFATNAITRGMPIEQVQTLLGHDQISTTTRYAIVDKLNVMNSAKRLMD